MSFVVLNVCRVCMRNDHCESLINNGDLLEKFEYTTRLAVTATDNLPTVICPKCVIRLKVAFDFVKSAHESEKSLKAFLAKVSNDFHDFTKATSDDTVTEPVDLQDNVGVLGLIEAEVQTTQAVAGEKREIPKRRIHTKVESLNGKRFKVSVKTEQSTQKLKEESECSQLGEEVSTASEIDDSYTVYEDANFVDEQDTEEAESNMYDELNDETLSQGSVELLQVVKNEGNGEGDNGDGEQHGSDGFLKEYEAMLQENEDNSIADYVDENSMEEIHIQADDIQSSEAMNTGTGEGCDSTMNSDETASTHMERKEERARSRKSVSSERPAPYAPRFYCVKCNSDFSTKTNLNRHMSSHEGNKPYTCQVCGKGFSQNGSLKQHMYTHTGEKPYVCEICKRGFTQCKSLIFHMRRHTGEKPFQCDHCGLNFRQKDALKIHILKHHMITEQSASGAETYTCVICQKLFDNKYALQAHMKKHINSHCSSTSAEDVLEFVGNEGEHQLAQRRSSADTESYVNEGGDNISYAAHVVDIMATSASEPSRAKKFQCRKCFKCFAIKKSLLRHLSIHDSPVDQLVEYMFEEGNHKSYS